MFLTCQSIHQLLGGQLEIEGKQIGAEERVSEGDLVVSVQVRQRTNRPRLNDFKICQWQRKNVICQRRPGGSHAPPLIIPPDNFQLFERHFCQSFFSSISLPRLGMQIQRILFRPSLFTQPN